MRYTAGILIVSDIASGGAGDDSGGRYLVEAFADEEINIGKYLTVPHDLRTIAMTLAQWAESGEMDFIVTTGGTGIGPKDITPEATRSVLEKELPGIVEAMRAEGYENTPTALLNRASAGIRQKCLIVNLPSNPEAIEDYLEILLPIIPHAVETLHGRTGNS